MEFFNGRVDLSFMMKYEVHSSDGAWVAWSTLSASEVENLSHIATGHFSSDPRVATVSLISENQIQLGLQLDTHYATGPAGHTVFINSKLFDLVAKPESMDLHHLKAWAEKASARNLFHLWVLTKVNSIQDSVLPPAIIDLEEIAEMQVASISNLQNLNQTELGQKKPFSLAIDISWFGNFMTGAQVAFANQLRTLEMNDSVHKIYLLTPGEAPQGIRDFIESGKTVIAPDSRKLSVDILWRPIQADRSFDFCNLKIQHTYQVISILDFIAYENPTYRKSHRIWKNYRKQFRHALSESDLILAISQDVKNLIVRRMPFLDSNRIKVVPLGVDHISKKSSQIAIHIEHENPYFLFIGTDYTHKNLDFAVRVCEKVRESCAELKLIVIGLNRNDLHTNSKWVEYQGFVSDEIKSDLISRATAVLYPTSAEGFGFIPFEAAALDTPTLFTEFGPLAEEISSLYQPKSWSVNEYSELGVRILTDPSFEQELVKEIKNAATHYSWINSTEALLQAFTEIQDFDSLNHKAVINPPNKLEKLKETLEIRLKLI